jgi:hypothetical protein
MHLNHDTMSSADRHGWRVLIRLAAITAAAFALVAASVSAAPATSSAGASGGPDASVAATKCNAMIQKGGKLVPVYERYFKYAFKKVKGSKKYKRVIVSKRRKVKTSCARQCVRTKKKKGKRVPVYKYAKRKVVTKKGNKLVRVRKRVRIYTYQRCKITQSNSAGTPVAITLLDGSAAHLDFGSFQRDAPLTGTLGGFIPGGYKLGQDNQLNLTRGNINLQPTDVFIDDDCKGGQVSAAIRTGDPTTIGLNPARQSVSQILASATVTATLYVRIHLPLALRNDDDGCDQPYITTGYSEIDQTFFFRGKIEKATGLTKLTLTSPPDPLDVIACLSPGIPTQPCNGFQIPLPILVNVKAVVRIKVG